METARGSAHRLAVSVGLILAVAVGSASCGANTPSGSATTTVSKPVSTAPVGPALSAPLSAPKTTPSQDAEYLSDVAKADPALVTYLQQQGNVGLRAVLTDGSAFCAFLQRGGGIDNALLEVAAGANSVEAQTHLPSTVTTLNTIGAVALLTLCTSEQRLVPAPTQAKLHSLGKALDGAGQRA
ncbi:MAG: hypothetical protein ACLP2J_15205 [Acidimicrobiales bacterium]